MQVVTSGVAKAKPITTISITQCWIMGSLVAQTEVLSNVIQKTMAADVYTQSPLHRPTGGILGGDLGVRRVGATAGRRGPRQPTPPATPSPCAPVINIPTPELISEGAAPRVDKESFTRKLATLTRSWCTGLLQRIRDLGSQITSESTGRLTRTGDPGICCLEAY